MNATEQTAQAKTRKPKWVIHYGNGGRQKCYTRKDIGDFLAYLVSTYPSGVQVTIVNA